MKTRENILIIGAGLCGSLLALRLAQRGYNVRLTEKRPDLRKVKQSAGRSINLAFSDRGMKGMKLCGIQNQVEKLCIPMHGRMIHPMPDENGKVNAALFRYSGRQNEYINSISRTGLNALLLDECDKMPNITIDFNLECKKVDLPKAKATFFNYNTNEKVKIKADLIFGTDGAGSVLRKSMFLDPHFRFSFSQDFLNHGYKELTFPPAENGGYLTEKGALHIWPRGENMLIALPNLDGSFTVTLFLSFDEGEYNFNNLNTPERITEYFQKFYPDALALMPDLVNEFNENPVGALGTVKCRPWSTYGKTLLMGDAAHAVVPFYGQGMNASFEDVVEFDKILDVYEGKNNGVTNWDKVFKEYEKSRKKDTDAIADLAVDNFDEMKSHSGNPLFQQKRNLETAFEAEFSEEYFSKYAMVTFREDLSYSEAMKIGRAQDKAILNLIVDGKITENQSLREKLELVLTETQDIIHDDAIAKNLI